MIVDPLNLSVGIDHHGKLFRLDKETDTWVPIQVVDPKSIGW